MLPVPLPSTLTFSFFWPTLTARTCHKAHVLGHIQNLVECELARELADNRSDVLGQRFTKKASRSFSVTE